MKSLPCFEGRYPVKAFFSDQSDCQGFADWKHPDTRYAELEKRLGVTLRRVVNASQGHSGNVLVVSEESADSLETHEGDSALESTARYDAIVTSSPGVLLCIWTADCLPLFLYDPRKRVIGIAHCGWRGICNGIASNTIDVMAKRFDTRPENVIAAFGPSICAKCYEVGADLKEAFSRRFSPDEVSSLFSPQKGEKYLLDLRKAVTFELARMGVRPETIDDVGICSYESEAYASYRRRGRLENGMQVLSGIVLAEG